MTKPRDADIRVIGLVAKRWVVAGALRNDTDAVEYEHVVPGLIYLKVPAADRWTRASRSFTRSCQSKT